MTPWGIAGAAAAVYAALVAFVAFRLLFPGVGRPRPAAPSWMHAFTLDIHGRAVHVTESVPDSAVPVCVLQHGLGECAGTLAQEAQLLRRLGFGIVMMDLPGHGGSALAATTYGVHESRLLREVLERLGLTDRVTVAWGRSVGAATVVNLAGALPRLTTIVADGMFESPLGSIVRHATERARFRPFLPLLPGVVAVIYLFLLARRATRFPAAVVGGVGVPILFITGSRDVGMPPRVQRLLLSRAGHPGSRFVEVADAGHNACFRTSPEPFERWLTRGDASDATATPSLGALAIEPGPARSA